MKFEGTTKTTFSRLRIVAISGKDRLCAECGVPFTEGDKVAIFASSPYEADDSVAFSEVFFVHVHKTIGESTCFEKFSARMVDSFASQLPEKTA